MSAGELNPGDLSKLNVLVTRPEHQQESLISAIESAGGNVISMPLINITPLSAAEITPSTSNAIKNLDQFDILIFISSNAASIGGDLIDNYWPQFPVGITVIAIGQTTSREVATLLNCAVIAPAQGSDSEAILALDQLQEVEGKRIGIIRGVGGRELLANELRQRGAQVEYMEVYRRDPRGYQPLEAEELLLSSECNVITVHSGESLQQLVELAGNNISKVTLLPLIVPSERVRMQAQQAAFATVINAEGADDQAMIRALLQVAEDSVQ